MKLKQIKKVIFDPISHTYVCGEKLLKGVTTLMKEHGLGADYSNIPEATLKKAAERGSAIHKVLECYDNGESVVGGEFDAELKAYKNLGLKVICSEYLISDMNLVASSIDKVLDIDSETEVDLGDVKTTSTLHMDALAWQLGIYKYLFEMQNKGIKVRKCWGIHVRDGKAKKVEVTPVSEGEVKALLDCEANGQLYMSIPDADSEVYEIIGKPELTSLLEVIGKIDILENSLKELKELRDGFYERIYTHMLNNNLDEMVCPGGIFKLKRPYETTRIDSTSLKKKMPEIYEQFAKTSITKGSITFKVN